MAVVVETEQGCSHFLWGNAFLKPKEPPRLRYEKMWTPVYLGDGHRVINYFVHM